MRLVKYRVDQCLRTDWLNAGGKELMRSLQAFHNLCDTPLPSNNFVPVIMCEFFECQVLPNGCGNICRNKAFMRRLF
jgi:hypothetical protein